MKALTKRSSHLSLTKVQFALILFCVIAASPLLKAQTEYVAQDLGALTVANAINSFGVVAGDDGSHAYCWSNGVCTDLGSLGGGWAQAFGINDDGTIVGQSTVTTNGATHAFLWKNGVMADLGTLGGNNSWAFAINNSGIIVGASYIDPGAYHAFMWSNGVMSDLGTLTGDYFSDARAINNSGLIVGESGRNKPIEDGYGSREFRFVDGLMTEAGPSGHIHTLGLNDSGDTVGLYTEDQSTPKAFLLSSGVVHDLGFGARPYGISNDGTVVGTKGLVAARYRNGAWTSLSNYLATIGLTGYSEAHAINNGGSIVGSASITNRLYGFLLKPVPVITLNALAVAGDVVRVSFTVTSTPAYSFTLLESDQPTGPWTASANAILSTNIPGGSYTFAIPLVGMGARFFQVRTP